MIYVLGGVSVCVHNAASVKMSLSSGFSRRATSNGVRVLCEVMGQCSANSALSSSLYRNIIFVVHTYTLYFELNLRKVRYITIRI